MNALSSAIFILFAIASVSAYGTCSNYRGVCVCKGSCPDFVTGIGIWGGDGSWSNVVTFTHDGEEHCAASKVEDNSVIEGEDGMITIENVYPFTYFPSYQDCSSDEINIHGEAVNHPRENSGRMMGSVGFVATAVAIMAVMAVAL